MLTRTYREVLLAHQPAHQGRMTGPGAERKFITIHHPITDRELAAHSTKARYGSHVAIGHATGCQFAIERLRDQEVR